MATVNDLVAQVKSKWQALGWDTTVDWSDREKPISGSSRALVRAVSSSVVTQGSQLSLQLVEIELTLARKRGPLETYADVRSVMHTAMRIAADPVEWSNLAAVRSSPVPQVEPENDHEKVGGVLTFAVRAQLALEV